jgi:hypothetical protein
MAERILIQQTSSGDPISVGDLNVYPVARSYRMIFPGGQGGMVWSKPLGVIVEDQHGSRQTIPLPDVTRRLQVAILLAGFLGSLLAWMIVKRTR